MHLFIAPFSNIVCSNFRSKGVSCWRNFLSGGGGGLMNCHPSPLDSTKYAQRENAQRSNKRCSRIQTFKSLLGRGSRVGNPTLISSPVPKSSSIFTFPSPTSSGGLALGLPKRYSGRRLDVKGCGSSSPKRRTSSSLILDSLPLIIRGTRRALSRHHSPTVEKCLAIMQRIQQSFPNLNLKEEGLVKQ